MAGPLARLLALGARLALAPATTPADPSAGGQTVTIKGARCARWGDNEWGIPPDSARCAAVDGVATPWCFVATGASDDWEYCEAAPPEPCGGRTTALADDVHGFFSAAVMGQRSRSEILAQVDWLLLDLEHSCTPGLRRDEATGSDVFEKVQTLAWQFLHDGPRLLRATELRRRWLQTKGLGSQGELELLAERARVLKTFANDTAAHGERWPPPADVAYPAGCGRYTGQPIGPLGGRRRGHGEWLRSPLSQQRWGGGNVCSLRVLSVDEWEAATPHCLAALFTRPFLVRGGGEAVLNRSVFTRPNLLSLLGEFSLTKSYIDDPRNKVQGEATFAKHLEAVRREAEDGEAQELVSRTPLRTRGVLYEHLFGGSSELLENNHQTLLRGMHLPEQLHGFVNTRTPLL